MGLSRSKKEVEKKEKGQPELEFKFATAKEWRIAVDAKSRSILFDLATSKKKTWKLKNVFVKIECCFAWKSCDNFFWKRPIVGGSQTPWKCWNSNWICKTIAPSHGEKEWAHFMSRLDKRLIEDFVHSDKRYSIIGGILLMKELIQVDLGGPPYIFVYIYLSMIFVENRRDNRWMSCHDQTSLQSRIRSKATQGLDKHFNRGQIHVIHGSFTRITRNHRVIYLEMHWKVIYHQIIKKDLPYPLCPRLAPWWSRRMEG